MKQIDPQLRHAIMRLLMEQTKTHPELRTIGCDCGVCWAAAEVLAILDAEQREYGPPIDVTDPSYQRAGS